MIHGLTIAEIEYVFGGDGPVQPFCPEGFRVGSINYDGQGNVTGWQCLNNSDGSSWYGSVSSWVSWLRDTIVDMLTSVLS